MRESLQVTRENGVHPQSRPRSCPRRFTAPGLSPGRRSNRDRSRSFRHEHRLDTSVAVQASIDRRDLLDPSPPLRVLEIEHLRQRPVEVKSDEGYLLIESREGVA